MSWRLKFISLALVLPAVSLAQQPSPWTFGESEWIDGKVYFVRFTTLYDPAITFICRPNRGLGNWRNEALEMRVEAWWGEEKTAEMIRIRVDDEPPRDLVGVEMVSLEGRDRYALSTGFLPDGKAMQRILRGNTLVVQLASTDGDGRTFSYSLSGITAAFNKMPSDCLVSGDTETLEADLDGTTGK